MAKKTYADRIVRLRALAGISGRELARLARISESHTNQLESLAPEGVAVRTLRGIARVFGVSIDWLYTGEGDAPAEREVKKAVEDARARFASASSRDSYV